MVVPQLENAIKGRDWIQTRSDPLWRPLMGAAERQIRNSS